MLCTVDNLCIKTRIDLESSNIWCARIHLSQLCTVNTRDSFLLTPVLPLEWLRFRRSGKSSSLKASLPTSVTAKEHWGMSEIKVSTNLCEYWNGWWPAFVLENEKKKKSFCRSENLKGGQPHTFTKEESGSIKIKNFWFFYYIHIYMQMHFIFHRHVSSTSQPSTTPWEADRSKDLS